MPSQQWEKPCPEHKTNLVPLGKAGGYLQLRNFTFLHYRISIWEQFRRWHLVTSCPQVVYILRQLPLLQRPGLKWEITSTAWKDSNLNRRTHSIGKTRMVPKPSKFTTAWWLASNSKNMPLAMPCWINREKSQISQSTKPTWFLLAKLVATYYFATSLFCTAQSPFRTNLDDGIW